MTQMRTIEIDFDLHKKIELERQSFDESPNDVLRRLTGIPTPSAPLKPAPASGKEQGWTGDGVFLPDGTDIRMSYNGKTYEGVIKAGGAFAVGGGFFYSPSDAARAVAVTKKGKKTNLNGWNYWQVKRPTDTRWSLLSDLRDRT